MRRMSKSNVLRYAENSYATALLLAVVVFAIYMIFFTKNFNGDGMGYARVVEEAGSGKLWSVSARLLFCPTGRVVQEVVQFVGIETRGVYILTVVNSAFGALGSAIFFLMCFSITGKRIISSLVAFGLAFSFAFWFWSANATSYPGNVLFLIISLYIIERSMESVSVKRYLMMAVLVGFTHAFATFFWLTAIILVPSIALIQVVIGNDKNRGTRLAAVLAYGLTYGIVLFIPLVIAGVLARDVSSISEFRLWLTEASHTVPPQLSLGNVMRGVIGIASSIFSMVELGPYVKSLAFGVPTVVESKMVLILELIAFVLFWMLLASCVYFIWKNRTKMSKGDKQYLTTLLLWSLPVVCFGMTWLGTDTERWLAMSPILWLLGILLYRISTRDNKGSAVRRKNMILAVVVLIVFSYNLGLTMYPNTRIDNNYFYKSACELNDHMGENDKVFLWGHDHIQTGPNLSYFFGKNWIHLHLTGGKYWDTIEERINEEVRETASKGGNLFVIGRVFLPKDMPESRYSDATERPSRRRLAEILSRWKREEVFSIGIDTYWKLDIDPSESETGKPDEY